MTFIKMCREPNIVLKNPTCSDVMDLMARIRGGDDGESLIVLSFALSEEPSAAHVELWIGRLNDCNTGAYAGWLVRHKPSGRNSSFVVAVSQPQGQFRTQELFGAFEDVRSECIVQEPFVEEAVGWFIMNGTRNPTLLWLDFLDSVRGV